MPILRIPPIEKDAGLHIGEIPSKSYQATLDPYTYRGSLLKNLLWGEVQIYPPCYHQERNVIEIRHE